jgi:hypothetical protein
MADPLASLAFIACVSFFAVSITFLLTVVSE